MPRAGRCTSSRYLAPTFVQRSHGGAAGVALAVLGGGTPPPGGLRGELPPSLTHFEEGLELQRADGRLLLQAPVGLSNALHLHLGALEELIGAVPVLDEAACDLQWQLLGSTGVKGSAMRGSAGWGVCSPLPRACRRSA